LHAVKGFNAKEDRRHDRRTISLDELIVLIAAAQRGRTIMGMSRPARSLCYRLAATSGLRYSEIASITPPSFDWRAPSVTVAAAYTKIGETATLPLPSDLAAFVSSLPPGARVFPLRKDKGARLLRHDLKAAGIAYRDASGLVFDFHSLRCAMATLADAAGVSPRVIQKLMRHSSLELTGRYTRPRAVDIETATETLPNLKPDRDAPESLVATGTCGDRTDKPFPLPVPYAPDGPVRSAMDGGDSVEAMPAAHVMASSPENTAADVP
jgi:integrase